MDTNPLPDSFAEMHASAAAGLRGRLESDRKATRLVARVALLVALTLVVYFVVAVVIPAVWYYPAGPAAYERIPLGAAKSTVYWIMGPETDNEGIFFGKMGFTEANVGVTSDAARTLPGHRVLTWKNDDYTLLVIIDANGRVVGKNLIRWGLPNEKWAIIRWIRSKLGI